MTQGSQTRAAESGRARARRGALTQGAIIDLNADRNDPPITLRFPSPNASAHSHACGNAQRRAHPAGTARSNEWTDRYGAEVSQWSWSSVQNQSIALFSFSGVMRSREEEFMHSVMRNRGSVEVKNRYKNRSQRQPIRRDSWEKPADDQSEEHAQLTLSQR
ncbi:hypothetical protein DPX16_1149 [Anabarilius grahami]|uniref:Uncharacterized protein n=1 Tax=Anabarilius grahami TaxID=495550 RepID=A0A3N0Y0V1_ANAGA|nr:hypothetical protein DPX16_1149 [Anabarilius grahami]